MSVIRHDAAIRWTENGQDYLHHLATKLHNASADTAQVVSSWASADLSTMRRVAIGSGVSDLRAVIRFDGQHSQLEALLAAGRRGATLEYFPSLANPSESYPCILLDDGGIGPDPDMWWNHRHAAEVRLRRIDGGSWVGVTEGTLFYYKAGNDAPGLTFTRAGAVGTYVDEDGILQNEATADVFRTSWVDADADGAIDTPTLLCEPARTNEVTQSEDLTHADWVTTGVSARTADQATGPENTAALGEIIEDGGATTHRVTQAVTGMTADAEYALSCWMSANTRTVGVLWFGETGSLGTNYVRAWFDLSTGAVGTTQAGGTGTHVRSYVEDWTHLVAGLYRCVVVGSVGNAATAIDAAIALADADASLSYTGDGASSLYAGYAQLEDNAVASAATSYVATTTAAVARNADAWYATWPHSPQAHTVYVKLIEHGAALGNNQGVVHIGDSTVGGDPRFQLESGGGVGYTVRHDNGTTNASKAAAAVPVYGDTVELRGVLQADGSVYLGQSINAAAEVVTTASSAAALGAAWSGTRIYLSSRGASNQSGNGLIAVKIAKGVKTLTEMRAL